MLAWNSIKAGGLLLRNIAADLRAESNEHGAAAPPSQPLDAPRRGWEHRRRQERQQLLLQPGTRLGRQGGRTWPRPKQQQWRGDAWQRRQPESSQNSYKWKPAFAAGAQAKEVG